jgi:hypothetical protein
VISPYIMAGTIDSTFYNTDSVLATMEAIMGVAPQNQYLATARLFKAFGQTADNLDPYDAIMPDQAILAEVNTDRDYRAQDSARLMTRFHEESEADTELNDILWKSIKGRSTPRPNTPGASWGTPR